MFRLKVAVIVGGLMLAWFGVQEFRLSSGTSAEPALMSLAELESGVEPGNGHVLIEQHIADFAGCVYEYEEKSNKVTHAFYPVISQEHSFFKELNELYEKYPNIDDAPESEYPKIEDFRVLVKTKRYKTVNSIPKGLKPMDNVQGLVINLVETVSEEEKKMIKSSFPRLNFEKVLIVEDNRKPSSTAVSLGMVGGGGVLALLGIGSFFMGRSRGGAAAGQRG